MMFVGKAPYRISLLGGGSDLDWFVNKENYGLSLGYSLEEFSYSILNILDDSSPNGILNYSIRENYKDKNDITHSLIKHALQKYPNLNLIELSSYGFASGGSGLGGSSSFLASLICCLNLSQNIIESNEIVAKKTCEIEIDDLKKPIGRQDQYLCSLGGINTFRFEKRGKVKLIELSGIKKKVLHNMIDNLYLIPTYKKRVADNVLKKFINDSTSIKNFKRIREIAESFIEFEDSREYKIENFFHKCMRESWEIKKNMSGIMNDDLFSQLKKIQNIPHNWIRLIGAGMGGYFLISSKVSQDEVINLANSNDIKFLSKANLSNKGAHAFKI